MTPKFLCHVFLDCIVPVLKNKLGDQWGKPLIGGNPYFGFRIDCGYGLSEEQASRLLRLGKDACDYFDSLVFYAYIDGKLK